VFDKITIQLRAPYATGKEFIIETQNNNNQRIYVQSINLNGKKVKKSFVDLEDVKKGGKLVLQMGDRPKDDYSK
jgi:putative alpha-1,2-mannosidase